MIVSADEILVLFQVVDFLLILCCISQKLSVWYDKKLTCVFNFYVYKVPEFALFFDNHRAKESVCAKMKVQSIYNYGIST